MAGSSESEPAATETGTAAATGAAAAMAAVVRHLRERRGVDFSGYRPTTLARRIRQAMAKADVVDLEAYLDHLRTDPAGLDTLLDTLLINVTSFFRDPEMWRDLQSVVLPSLLERIAGRPLRVWSAGCASGEEAYSVAIVLAEMLGRDTLRERVKIYATDVDSTALSIARAASYSDRVVQEIPETLREEYLQRTDGDHWKVAADLRRVVVFGRNDILQDAPISRIDLLICRNTLMYFTADTQARILDRLHFATASDGILMLGRAETALGHQGLFSPLDGYRRFFRKQELAHGGPRRGLDLNRAGVDAAEVASEVDRLHAEALLEGPVAQVVVSRSGRVTFANRRAVATLPITEKDLGRLVQDTDLSFRPVDLRSLLMQVRTELRPATTRDVRWTIATGQELVMDVTGQPLIGADGAFLGTAVTYLDVTTADRLAGELDDVRQRLQASYQDIQSTTEELETTNEELQSTVEELETTNEELQSTNEELETTNEELRAVNEELFARGTEEHALAARAEDLNTIFDSVMDGLETGVIVVDTDLRVLVWTRTSQELWGLRAEEVVGRSLGSLDIGLDPARLVHHARILMPVKPPDGGGPFATARTSEWLEAVNRRGKAIRVRLAAQLVVLHDGLARVILTVESGASVDERQVDDQQTDGQPDGHADGQAGGPATKDGSTD